jgi:carboxylesterase type B
MLAIYIFLILCSNQINSITIAKCAKTDSKIPILKSTKGKIKGSCEHIQVNDENIMRDENVYSWLGIPYAEPPIGKKRFEAPVSVKPWNHILDGTKWPNSCVQITNNNKFEGYKMWTANENISKPSEDCLYLNIWMRVDAYLKKNLRGRFYKEPPIMVVFTDQYLTSGTSVLEIYDPSTFVALTGIIVVTLNYRLGPFGFLHLDDHITGNQALLDQNLALKWVYENADIMGGDRSKITLVGSTMVGYHLLYKPSWSLFNNVIVQSGSPFQTSLTPVSSIEATKRAVNFAEYAGCGKNKIISCLKEMNEFKLIKAADEYFSTQLLSGNEKTWAYLKIYFPLVIDGVIISEFPETSFKNGNYKNCSILTGFNINEGSTILDKSDSKKSNQIKSYSLSDFNSFLAQYFYYYPTYPTKNSKDLIKTIFDEYKNLSRNPNYFRTLERLLTHESCACGVLKLADEYSRYNKAYVYLYAHRISTSPWIIDYGTVHRDELAMTFAHPVSIRPAKSSNPWLIEKEYSISERRFCYQIVNYWSNFIRNNNPNYEDENSIFVIKGAQIWPEYKSASSMNTNILRLQSSKVFKINNFSLVKCQFWSDFLTKIKA